ncbi:uncharacterized protein OGAPODRAFT_44463 [Ogataea polymorpha]|uniref:uncharacterized protein n=1 Tax=Ogataea polymorpha TaxID=460523 RepID=UPI0007F4B749|nr:uncharacterized protein OGAPODRAFT_44463 [Ogataea polymorpha]OBA18309.1 hypothetical protein OGAPODRAFT_44463 [Ogataea polymorpha]
MSNHQTEEEVFEFLNSLPENNGQPNKESEKTDEDILEFLNELEAKEKSKTPKTKQEHKKTETVLDYVEETKPDEIAEKKPQKKPVQLKETTEQVPTEHAPTEEVSDPITSFSSWWSKEGSAKVTSQFSSLWGTAESAINYAREQKLEDNLKKAFQDIGITGVLEALEKIQLDIDANKDEILDIKLVHDLKNYKGLPKYVKSNFETVMRAQVDGDIQVRIAESGILSSSAETSDQSKSLGLFAGKLSDGEKLIHANIESVIKANASKEDTEATKTRKSDIYIGLLAISISKEDSPAEESEIVTIDEYQPSSFSFTSILVDQTHDITIVNRSQPFPLKWCNWLDGKYVEGEASEEVDPSEWVADWINRGLDMMFGVLAQTYIIKRMGY